MIVRKGARSELVGKTRLVLSAYKNIYKLGSISLLRIKKTLIRDIELFIFKIIKTVSESYDYLLIEVKNIISRYNPSFIFFNILL